jgi:hypothetical protein
MYGATAAASRKRVWLWMTILPGVCASTRAGWESARPASVIWPGRGCWPRSPAGRMLSSARCCLGACRAGEGADRVMGLFINTLPVRMHIGEEGVEASVRRTHILLADLMRHEHASLALAQRCSAVPAPAPAVLGAAELPPQLGGPAPSRKPAGLAGHPRAAEKSAPTIRLPFGRRSR